jgi:hypothetical protein
LLKKKILDIEFIQGVGIGMQLDETSTVIVSNYLTSFKTEVVTCNLVSCGLSQESLLQIWRGF